MSNEHGAKLDAEELTLAKLAEKYSNPAKARKLVENMVWPDGAKCPHCKSSDPYKIVAHKKSKAGARQGLYKCRNRKCAKQFTVTVGTVFEKTQVPLSKWVMALFVLSSSKKGISAHQLHRMIGVTYKTSWFMLHRLRYAMGSSGKEINLSGIVEADEAFFGGKPKKDADGKIINRGYRKDSSKTPVVALIERGGDVRTKVVANVSKDNLKQFVEAHVDKSSHLHTDNFPAYKTAAWNLEKHVTVNHATKEFSRHEQDGSVAHVNTCESFFSLLKRGMYGSFHHVSREHLHRYCDEFSFRWNHRKVTDGERMEALLGQVSGKRLTYQGMITHACNNPQT